MSEENCGEWRNELAECARRGVEPSGRLWAHLSNCAPCAAHWEAERALSAEFGSLRLSLAGLRSPDVWRRRLMAEFGRLQELSAPSRLRWAWIPASAALMVVASLQIWLGAPGRNAVPRVAVQSQDLAVAGPQETIDDNGFIPVPYALPLATGESVRVVRQELNGADLVRMGIDLPGAYAADLADDFEANVLLGEDELPRAVQLVSYPDL